MPSMRGNQCLLSNVDRDLVEPHAMQPLDTCHLRVSEIGHQTQVLVWKSSPGILNGLNIVYRYAKLDIIRGRMVCAATW